MRKTRTDAAEECKETAQPYLERGHAGKLSSSSGCAGEVWLRTQQSWTCRSTLAALEQAGRRRWAIRMGRRVHKKLWARTGAGMQPRERLRAALQCAWALGHDPGGWAQLRPFEKVACPSRLIGPTADSALALTCGISRRSLGGRERGGPRQSSNVRTPGPAGVVRARCPRRLRERAREAARPSAFRASPRARRVAL